MWTVVSPAKTAGLIKTLPGCTRENSDGTSDHGVQFRREMISREKGAGQLNCYMTEFLTKLE